MYPRTNTKRAFALLLLFSALSGAVAAQSLSGATLRVAVAQVGISAGAEENLARVLEYVNKAADAKARVVVLPEGVLRETAEASDPDTIRMLHAIAKVADQRDIYVMLGLWSRIGEGPKGYNWMVLFGPDGREVFRYEKLYDRHQADLPRIFYIDGIPCSAVLCADRWLRAAAELPIIEGARISFELSDNTRNEWVPSLGLYWYVPRAIRNSVYVVFANSAAGLAQTQPACRSCDAATPAQLDRHGHSAIIDPTGRLVAAAKEDAEELIVADLDISKATRAEAERRRTHPVFHQLWETARRVRDGEMFSGEFPVLGALSKSRRPEPRESAQNAAPVEITIAAAQMAVSRDPEKNVDRMVALIEEAASRHPDIMVFPELALTGDRDEDILAAKPPDLARLLGRLCDSAKKNNMAVVFGMPDFDSSLPGRRPGNAAVVIGPDGAILTRYHQMVVDRPDVFEPGWCPEKMWFKVKGASALVTVGREIVWNEIGEMAAVAGAQLLFNISHDVEGSPEAALRRLQIAENFASFGTFTAVVNPAIRQAPVTAPSSAASMPHFGGTTIWDDPRGEQEIRAAVRREPQPATGETAIYASFAANCVAAAGRDERIIYATRKLNPVNPFHQDTFYPRMRPWYLFGARLVTGCF